ncbi:cellulose binding domain-containing protein [Actinomadura sp. WMMB 499]|uniref:cellulose binding domain-containing protein n=1 Tax=Actinomadura sp. WMMB 499 TaxID=1219491 RepID=UPI001243AE6A|nr:cellulose binding domain-containing protein [Actinomadura sp. WMMB 499]QFG25308.1 hypothetical protein F7P10_33320 [Actinomadura sp. WMMB 499]
MSGDERRYVPPDTPTATRFTAADPGATAPDPPVSPDDPADAATVPEPPGRREEPEALDVRVAPLHAPPVQPSGGTAEFADPAAAPPPVRDRGGNVRGPALALGAGVLAVAVALAAMFVLGGDGGAERGSAPATPSREAAGGAAPVPTDGGGAAPAPTDAPSTEPPASEAPAAGVPTAGPGRLQGVGVTYEVGQRDSGYYEGTFVLTNRTGAPMTSWRLSFVVPGGDVRNVWGGRLVQGGERVVIENAAGAAAVPPGGTVTVRFGAAGVPAAPAECVLNGAGCGL